MQSFWQDLPKPFFALAPMESVTDTVFRRVVAHAAAPDVFFTEFVNTDSFCNPQGRQSTNSRLQFTPEEQPLIAQIWGNNPAYFSQMSKELAKMGFAGIDINMGCPVKDIIKKGACSALIDTPELAGQIIAATKEGGLPVSVKTRLGFKRKNTVEWLSFLLNQDLAALTVHGRIAKDMSKYPADWSEIALAVKLRDQIAPQTIIIGNGDIIDRQDGLQKAAQTGVDGIMIGRGIFGNVFCFEQQPQAHSLSENLDLLRLQLDLYDQTWQDSKRPFGPLKRFFKIYVRAFDGASSLREKLMGTTSTAEARAVLAEHERDC